MDIKGVSFLLLIIAVTLFVTEKLGKKNASKAFISRKLLHIAGVGCLALAPVFFSNHLLLTVIVLVFFMVLLVAVKQHWLVADIYNRLSWGIALFPFSFLCLWLLFGKQAPWLVIYPMLVLTFADAGAAISGGLFAKNKFKLSGDEKSYLGSFVFTSVTIIVLGVLPLFLRLIHPLFGLDLGPHSGKYSIWVIIFVIALFAAGAEAATSGGWDNVTVPLSVGWLLAVMPQMNPSDIELSIWVLIGLGGLGLLAWLKKWLDSGGSVTAVLLGFIIWIASGWQALLLIGVFFISGSLLGKLNSHSVTASDSKSGKVRDFMQVLCNGGVAGACLLWYGLSKDQLPLQLFAISVAVSTADTWSSEVGIWSKGRVVNIIGFKSLPVGLSGGISCQGTLAGLAGSILIGLIAFLFGFSSLIWVSGFGFLGMLADSAAGSLFQARYREANVMLDTRPESGNFELEKGFAWITNDLVNLLSNLFIVILACFLLYFCG